MIATITDADGDAVELYAEVNPIDYIEKADWDAYQDGRMTLEEVEEKYPLDNMPTFEDLKKELLRQAEAYGLTEKTLIFKNKKRLPVTGQPEKGKHYDASHNIYSDHSTNKTIFQDEGRILWQSIL